MYIILYIYIYKYIKRFYCLNKYINCYIYNNVAIIVLYTILFALFKYAVLLFIYIGV